METGAEDVLGCAGTTGEVFNHRALLASFEQSLLELAIAPPNRRPRVEEMDTLEVKAVRPLVEVGQPRVVFNDPAGPKPIELELLWLERWGGTFGSASSAEANSRRGRSSAERFLGQLDRLDGAEPPPERLADRGGVPAWLLYLACPQCRRRCRILYSLRGRQEYGCRKCNRPAWRSNTWTPSGKRSKGPLPAKDRERLQHEQAAERIRRNYLNDARDPGAFSASLPASVRLRKPPYMTWERFEALARLVEAHETLALLATLEGMQLRLSRMGGGLQVTAEGEQGDQEARRWAQRVLAMDAWALRQKSWHRRGQPRDTPGQGTRARLRKQAAAATLETSKDVSGHAQQTGGQETCPAEPPAETGCGTPGRRGHRGARR